MKWVEIDKFRFTNEKNKTSTYFNQFQPTFLIYQPYFSIKKKKQAPNHDAFLNNPKKRKRKEKKRVVKF